VAVKVTEPVGTQNAFREEFEPFYTRERAAVIGLAYVLSGSRLGAEDLAQEAFVAAFRHWDKVAGYDDPGAWVRRVLVNRVTSRFRRRRSEARALIRLQGSNFTIPPIDPEAEALWSEVRKLPNRQAQTIALRYLDDRDTGEIASILECSENTVRTHLRRGRETLAKRLADKETP
jgi:RNA polymerase sigma-70 factor, ECF subfamily